MYILKSPKTKKRIGDKDFHTIKEAVDYIRKVGKGSDVVQTKYGIIIVPRE